MKFTSQQKRNGFTLIELMTVITIIGILMAIALTTLFEARKEARDRSRVAELEQLKLSLKLYKEATGEYPVDTPDYTSSDGVEVTNSYFASDLETYTASAYEDPLNTGDYRYWYDSDFDCDGKSYTVVGAQTLEVEGNTNFTKVCTNPSGVVANEAPLSDANNSYIVLVRKNP